MAPKLSQTRFKSIKRSYSALGSSEAKIQTGTQSQKPASSSLVVTPVPFAPTGDMFFKETSKHVGGVSSVSQSTSVTNVRDVPAVVTSPPVGGRLQEPVHGWCPF